jgi:septum formation protein
VTAPRLVLASASPRRADLLRSAGIPFDLGEPPGVDESPPSGASPEEVARGVAVRKARRGAERHPGRVVLAADTVVSVRDVALGDDLLGKPRDAEEAVRTLLRLSGRAHRVATGVAVASPSGRVVSGFEVATVRFRPLDEGEVRRYVATGEPLDKAGAYAIQGGAAPFVERLEGEVDTVVGLPVALLRRLLREAGAASLAGEGAGGR